MCKADNLPPYCAIVKKPRSLNFLDLSGPAWPVTGVLYLYPNIFCNSLLLSYKNPNVGLDGISVAPNSLSSCFRHVVTTYGRKL